MTSPVYGDGQLVPTAAPVIFQSVYVVIGGAEAEMTYAGAAPGTVNGIMQVNARIPATINPGSAVPLFIWEYPYHSQTGITVAVK